MSARYEDVEPEAREFFEEVILNQSADGDHVERSLEFAGKVRNPPAATAAALVAFPLRIERSTPEQQREFLRSLTCKMKYKVEHVVLKSGASTTGVCRLEGAIETSKIAEAIIAGKTPTPSEVLAYFNGQLKERICCLDGGMGTRIQAEDIQEEDFRGDLFPNPPKDLQGNTDLLVSECCLGGMTWGNQNTNEDAAMQLNFAFDNGVNFLDTAEGYPVPMSPETQGATEARGDTRSGDAHGATVADVVLTGGHVDYEVELVVVIGRRGRNADLAGRFVFNDNDEVTFNFGKYRGVLLRDVLQRDPGYYGWMMNGDFPRYTKLVLKEEMEAMKAG